MPQRLPSIKRLIANHLVNTEEDARRLRNLLANNRNTAANILMGTHGLETLCWPKDAFINCYTPTHTLEHFNAGDTYATTLLSIDAGPWFIGSVGDTLQHMNRSYGEAGR